MTAVCAWCGRVLGIRPPFDDERLTHGICAECMATHFPKKGAAK